MRAPLSKRPQSAIRQPMVRNWSRWDNQDDVRAILEEHEMGVFTRSGQLFDAFLSDPRIYAVLDQRLAGVVGAPLSVTPANDKRVATKAADALGGGGGRPGLWDEFFPPELVEQVLMYGLGLGIGLAHARWTDYRPQLTGWHPQFIRYDWTLRRFVVQAETEWVTLPDVAEQRRSDGEWLVYCPYGVENGWNRSLIRPLAALYLVHRWTLRDWARYCEKHGLIATKAKVPFTRGGDPKKKEDFVNDIINIGSEPVVECPVDEKGDGYDFEYVEAQSKTWETFQAFLAYADTEITILVLGQNLTTEVSGGSFAAAKEHGQQLSTKNKRDAMIATTLRQQVLTYWAEANYGDAELAPFPAWQVEPPEDEAKRAEVLKTTVDALAIAKDAEIPVDARAVLEAAKIPMLEVVEEPADGDVIAPAPDAIALTPSAQAAIVTVDEARAAAGLPPLPEDGGLTISEYQAKHAQVVADAAKAEAGKAPGDPEPAPPIPPGQTPPAGGEDETKEQDEPKTPPNDAVKETLSALAQWERFERTRLSAAERVAKAAPPKGKTYADRVTVSAVRAGARKLDKAPLLQALRAATSWDDLRQRLLAAYRGLSSAEFARLMASARVMARAGGMATAVEDV